MNYKKFCDVKNGVDVEVTRMSRIRANFRNKNTTPEETVVHKRLVQACLPKRRMLPGGQSAAWSVDEIDREERALKAKKKLEEKEKLRLAGED
jgi:hypothetical protein